MPHGTCVQGEEAQEILHCYSGKYDAQPIKLTEKFVSKCPHCL